MTKFGLKITVLPWATFLVSIGNIIIACNFMHIAVLMTSKGDKLPLEMEPVALDNNAS